MGGLKSERTSCWAKSILCYILNYIVYSLLGKEEKIIAGNKNGLLDAHIGIGGMSVKLFEKKSLSREAYLVFVQSYKGTMFRIALGYLKEEADAMEAVDETVYIGLYKLHQLREEEKLKPWMTKILVNECHRLLKGRKRELVTESLPENQDVSSRSSLTLREAISELPEDLREVIILRYFGDLTVKDTAVELNLPQGTVATRTRKALEILKEKLISWEGGVEHESV